ncbi:MAG: hypothetical protein IIB42_07010 [Candidatus Marinimicrobia bacterium]|nr:hypothetical protein [Candidatus Neomarinimicrobiota bacterium]
MLSDSEASSPSRRALESWVSHGANITYPLTLEPWGLLNFVIADPDGHQIAIGERKDAAG